MADTEQKIEKKNKKTADFISAVGRRKTAVARIFLKEEKGEFILNGKDINEYFDNEIAQSKWLRPFHAVGISHPKAKYSATIKVVGSGKTGQVDAVTHAISRALAKLSEEFRAALAKQGFMTRDPRMVERKKYYLHKARKRPQYSKR